MPRTHHVQPAFNAEMSQTTWTAAQKRFIVAHGT